MQLIPPILLLTCCLGCKTVPFPPMPPVAKTAAKPSRVPAAIQAPRQVMIEAYFNPGQATTGFFESSADLVNWETAYSFPYPTQGAWVGFTNYNSTPCFFFRAGFSL